MFQPSRPKTVGGNKFLASKSELFMRGEKHIKTQKYKLCKIDNEKNNKTADI